MVENKITKFKSRVGFTLLELIIYVAIVGGLSAFVAGAFIIANRGGSVAQARYAVNSNMRIALESIQQDIKNAKDLLTPIFTVNSSTLVLRVGVDEITYDVAGGRLRRNGLNITSESVVVSSPSFRQFVSLNIPSLTDAVNINSTLTIAYNTNSPDSTFSETLSRTVLLEPFFSWPARGYFGSPTGNPGPCGDFVCNIPCLSGSPVHKHYTGPFNLIGISYAAPWPPGQGGGVDPCNPAAGRVELIR